MGSSNNKYWLSSGKFTLLERVFMLLFGVVTFYLLVRSLNKVDFGVWVLFITIHSFLDTARNGFFKNPLIRFLGKVKEADKSKLQGSSLLLNIGFSVVASIVLLFFAVPISNSFEAPGLVSMLWINVVLNFVLSFFTHFEFVQIARMQFKGPMVGNFVRSGTFCLFVVYTYISGNGQNLAFLTWMYTLAAGLGVLIMLPFVRVYIVRSIHFQMHWIRELFHYGKYTLGTNLSAVFMRNIDVWMLGWYISPAAVAIYNVAIRIANLFEVPTMAMASVLFPQAVKEAEEKGESALKELYERSVSILFVMLLPLVVGVIVCSDIIVELIAGPDYAQAGIILNITMLYGLIVPFNKQLGILLDAVGKAKLNMLFVLRNAVINTILNALLIPIWGVEGAAMATLSTFALVMVINQFYLNRNFEISVLSMGNYMREYAVLLPKKILQKIRK